MIKLPEYRIRELAQFFTAMTGKDPTKISSNEMYRLMCSLESPFAFRQRFRYRLQGFVTDFMSWYYKERKPKDIGVFDHTIIAGDGS